jgi:hypothetical protein
MEYKTTVTGCAVAFETKKRPFFAKRSGFLQAVILLRLIKSAKYGGKWAF